MILLRLFVSWDRLQSRFLLYIATISLYLSLFWQIWLDVKRSLDKYIFYYTNNILPMRKSQIAVKLDQEQQYKAKKLATKTSLQELVEQNEVEDSIQELYGANKPEKLDFKSLQQVVCITIYNWRLADIIEYLKYTSLAHTQHYFQNAEDKKNFKGSFLPYVDLFNATPHIPLYPGVMTGFNLENTALWKKIGKKALTKQINIVETKTNAANINTPF